MLFDSRVYAVLVVSRNEKFNTSINSLLTDNIYYPVVFAGSASAARRALLEQQFDIVIINTPLNDEFGSRLALDVSSDRNVVSLLIVRTENYEEICAKVIPEGVFVLRKPATQSAVVDALSWLSAAREKIRRMEKSTFSLEERMEEIRIFNRAKWRLIEQSHLSEEEAHKYIERLAMDQCITKRQAAEALLSDQP